MSGELVAYVKQQIILYTWHTRSEIEIESLFITDIDHIVCEYMEYSDYLIYKTSQFKKVNNKWYFDKFVKNGNELKLDIACNLPVEIPSLFTFLLNSGATYTSEVICTAANRGHLNFIKYLKEKLNVYSEDELICAAISKFYKVVEYLLKEYRNIYTREKLTEAKEVATNVKIIELINAELKKYDSISIYARSYDILMSHQGISGLRYSS